MEYSKYYETILYPIQNEVLKIMKDLNLPFYLTGGTAVSRGYFHHRYSDDLDFFCNKELNFSNYVETALSALENAGKKLVFGSSSSPDFTRVYINQNVGELNKNGLKVDFVNDIDIHFGNIQETDVYYRTDSIRNILSNKYTALYRLSVKDVVDIYEISKNYAFNWNEIINEANAKEGGIDLKEVVSIFKSYSDKDFEHVKWIKKTNIIELRNGLEQISKNMLLLENNSLCERNLSSVN